jgi:hypothetical protein
MAASDGPLDRAASPAYLDEHTSNRTTTAESNPLRNLSHPARVQDRPPSPTPSDKGNKARCCSWRQAFGGKLSRYWVWELLASAFSMICIATIVIVLLYEDGKPLDQWSLMISPNAVISFIAALAKSSCILVLAEVIGQLRWIRFAHQPCELNDLQVRV